MLSAHAHLQVGGEGREVALHEPLQRPQLLLQPLLRGGPVVLGRCGSLDMSLHAQS